MMDLEKGIAQKAGHSAQRPIIFVSKRDAALSRQQAAEALLGYLLRDEGFLRVLREQQE